MTKCNCKCRSGKPEFDPSVMDVLDIIVDIREDVSFLAFMAEDHGSKRIAQGALRDIERVKAFVETHCEG
jgi:hypothetical protein